MARPGQALPEVPAELQALLASLPESYGISSGVPELAYLDGSDLSWTDLAQTALEGGAHAVVVLEPTCDTNPERVDALARTAGEQGSGIWVDSLWASHPTLRACDPIRLAEGEHLTSRVVASSADRSALFAHIQALVALGVDLEGFRWVKQWRHGYGVSGFTRNSESEVLLRGISSSAADSSLSVVLRAGAAERHIRLPDRRASWPGTVLTVDARGALSAPAIYESASRFLWRSVAAHALGPGEGTGSDALADLSRALRLLARLDTLLDPPASGSPPSHGSTES